MEDIEQRLTALEERNHRVDRNKEWETSVARRTAIAILTYLFVGVFFVVIHVAHPWVNAIVPVLGFVLSTWTLLALRKIWERSHL